VFIYKINKHKFFQKCKACLIVYKNQQAPENLFTKVTILMSMIFWTLMVIIAKFDLEITQINTVNIFIYCDFNKVIYIKLLPEFNKGKKDKILCLKKALYGL